LFANNAVYSTSTDDNRNIPPYFALLSMASGCQWLYVDPSRETVIAKFSSQPEPTNDDFKRLNLALLATIAVMA
jgi:CubicO group peptidase (beta-lactamase class C family)